MPSILASLQYLRNLPLYETVKPYWCFLSPTSGIDPDKVRLDNLEFETICNINISDIRELLEAPKLEDYGFEILNHQSNNLVFATAESTEHYKRETEQLLKTKFNAEFVRCYDHRLRKNITFERSKYDLNDPLLREGPAQGAHIDLTYKSGPEIVVRHLTAAEQTQYLRPGNRVRVINTWRSLLPVLEDSPLAVCDARTILNTDLKPTDRVLPNIVGEVYFLIYNPAHKWYWLEKQKSDELLVMAMYDTQGGGHARYCPHVSFENPKAGERAQKRESIETRSIVITRVDEQAN